MNHIPQIYLHSTIFILRQTKKALRLLFEDNLHSTIFILRHPTPLKENLFLFDLHSTIFILRLMPKRKICTSY